MSRLVLIPPSTVCLKLIFYDLGEFDEPVMKKLVPTQNWYGKNGTEPLGGTSSRCQPVTFYIKRIWNMDKQLSEFCGISTGIQIHHHVIMFRITNGLPLGTSNTDSWRLKPSIRCQLLVDRSELCFFHFFSSYSQSVRAKKERKQEK